MEFRCFCDNKGCGKEMRPTVDKTTMVAYCAECGKAVNSISIFMRRQMVAHDQVRRNEKKKLPWAVKCSACSKELDSLAKPFAEMIKVNLIAQRRAG